MNLKKIALFIGLIGTLSANAQTYKCVHDINISDELNLSPEFQSLVISKNSNGRDMATILDNNGEVKTFALNSWVNTEINFKGEEVTRTHNFETISKKQDGKPQFSVYINLGLEEDDDGERYLFRSYVPHEDNIEDYENALIECERIWE